MVWIAHLIRCDERRTKRARLATDNHRSHFRDRAAERCKLRAGDNVAIVHGNDKPVRVHADFIELARVDAAGLQLPAQRLGIVGPFAVFAPPLPDIVGTPAAVIVAAAPIPGIAAAVGSVWRAVVPAAVRVRSARLPTLRVAAVRRMNGGLDLLSKLLGKPGKLEIRGDQVYAMFLEGKIQEINDYCAFDTLDTYFVLLRTRVLTGELTLEGDLTEAAANLFGYLRALDAKGAHVIAVMPIPDHGLGGAINDRLRRAAVERQ